MSWRMQRDQRVSPDRQMVAFVNRLPLDGISMVLLRPWILEKPCAAMISGDCGHAGRMVGMSMCHQDIAKLCMMAVERGRELLEMTALTHAGVNQNSRPVFLNHQVRVIA